MRTSHILTGVVLLGILSTGCVRETEVKEPEKKPDAGKGGNTTLRLTPQHHLKNIDSCWIYVKYNATSKPSSMVFDDSMKVTPEDGRPIANFPNLKKGDYYFYGAGWDYDLAEVVTGGTSFKVVDTLQNKYDIYLAVSEKH
jgi:hypothetical protein